MTGDKSGSDDPEPQEIGNLVLHLAIATKESVNGESITVDGGQTNT